MHSTQASCITSSTPWIRRDRPWEATDRRLADVVTTYWTSFAARGDPNGPGVPAWPVFDEQEELVMQLGDTIGPIPTPHGAQVAFYQREIEEWLEVS